MKKVFPLLFVSFCFGFIGLVLCLNAAHAQPPFPGGLPACLANLNTCEAQPPAPVPQTGQTTSVSEGDDGDVQAGVVPPDPRFTDNEDGTITDNLTGLVWLENMNCGTLGPANWATALSNVNNLAFGACGLSDGSIAGDWYLPNRNQLTSLLDLENFSPALPTGHLFMNFQQSNYWSSTTGTVNPIVVAWVINYNFGTVLLGNKASVFFVTAVRGGL